MKIFANTWFIFGLIMFAVWVPQFINSWSIHNAQASACDRGNIVRNELNDRAYHQRRYYSIVISDTDVPPTVAEAAKDLKYDLNEIPTVDCSEAVQKPFPFNLFD